MTQSILVRDWLKLECKSSFSDILKWLNLDRFDALAE